MTVRANDINTWCISMTAAVTVSNGIAIASLVTQIGRRQTDTETDRQARRQIHAHTHAHTQHARTDAHTHMDKLRGLVCVNIFIVFIVMKTKVKKCYQHTAIYFLFIECFRTPHAERSSANVLDF